MCEIRLDLKLLLIFIDFIDPGIKGFKIKISSSGEKLLLSIFESLEFDKKCIEAAYSLCIFWNMVPILMKLGILVKEYISFYRMFNWSI